MPQVASTSTCSETANRASRRACCFSVISAAPVWRRAARHRAGRPCGRGARRWPAGRGGGTGPEHRRPGARRGTGPSPRPRRQFLAGGGLETGEPVHRNHLDAVAPGVSRSPSQVLHTCFDRPSTISSSRAGPVPSRIGVRSMITVTYLSPRRVWRQHCSSTPITRTPSNRCGSSINTLPSASTASFAVFHDTPRPSATRATVKCRHTMPSAPIAARDATASPAARRPGWCPGATRACSRCSDSGGS